MKSTYSALMQSRFFNPAFNSAIFDGPVRIYFSQIHESLALKIYFSLQQKAQNELALAKGSGRSVLVMLYPNHESFQMSFDEKTDEKTDGQDGLLVLDVLDGDSVVGINGPFEDDQLSNVVLAVQKTIQGWGNESTEVTPLFA